MQWTNRGLPTILTSWQSFQITVVKRLTLKKQCLTYLRLHSQYSSLRHFWATLNCFCTGNYITASQNITYPNNPWILTRVRAYCINCHVNMTRVIFWHMSILKWVKKKLYPNLVKLQGCQEMTHFFAKSSQPS